jgi:hypothetical protein
MRRNPDPGDSRECEICGKQVMTQSEMEDHVAENHPDAATPELRDTYSQRRRGTGADYAA